MIPFFRIFRSDFERMAGRASGGAPVSPPPLISSVKYRIFGKTHVIRMPLAINFQPRPITLIFCTLLSIPTTCFSETGTGKVAQIEGKNNCDFAAPRAILIPNIYKNHKFESAENNQATESALIEKEVQLQIQYWSCVDGVSQQFTVTVPRQSRKADDIQYWSDFVRRKLSALKVSEDGAYIVRGLVEFLEKVPSYEPHGRKISICMDGSTPGLGGCSWLTGGSHIFEIRQKKTYMIVTVAQDVSH